jgi:hypothetical protein
MCAAFAIRLGAGRLYHRREVGMDAVEYAYWNSVFRAAGRVTELRYHLSMGIIGYEIP